MESEVRQFYFKDAAIDEKSLMQYLELFSDIYFTYGVDKAAKQHAKKLFSKSYYLRCVVHSILSDIHI